MREDIKKLFSNQYHSYYKEKFPRTSKKYCRTDVDGEPIESLKKPYILSGDRHYGADLDYNFFRRLLVGNVGKNWDEVYSEICKQTDLRNFVGNRLRHCIDFFVEQNCTIDENGEVCNCKGMKMVNSWRTAQLYVHPVTNELCLQQRKRKQKREKKKKVFEMDGKNFHFHEGIWYRVEMCEAIVVNCKLIKEDYSRFNDSFGVETPYVVNDYYGSYHYCGPIRKKYGFSPAGKPWYAKSKESACKKEIDKLKKKYNLI